MSMTSICIDLSFVLIFWDTKQLLQYNISNMHYVSLTINAYSYI